MKNMEQLRTELSRIFYAIDSGAIKTKDGAEMINATGKIVNSVKVELEYYKLRKEKPEIAFLANDEPAERT